ncbi:MAG: iron ABC transporter permease [Chloroflexaceae bacterium]|jgi:iron complex transport system permease protein|nr:iron ABC transporter permease [Chloroflexaceae bacterium]
MIKRSSAPSLKPETPWLTARTPRLSFRVDKRVPPVLALALLATLAAMIINIGVGEYPIPPLDVLRTVLGLPTGNEDYSFIVNTLRLPRMLVAALVGMALGVSGAIMQGLTRNPLADPGIIGISAGASLVAVTLIVLVRDVPAGVLPVAAFAGAAVTALLIYVLAWKGGDSPIRLILVGVGLAAVAYALTTLMITFGDIYDVQRALIWLTGSVYGRSWEEFWPLLPWIVVFVPLACFMARHLNALNLGEEVARGLGSRVAAHRGLLLLTAVALAGATVAAAGTIGFVGLMAPHIARRLVGPDHTGLLPTAGVLGGFIVVAADLVGRTIFAPIELPCGLVTAAIGAPFFIALLWKQQRGNV